MNDEEPPEITRRKQGLYGPVVFSYMWQDPLFGKYAKP